MRFAAGFVPAAVLVALWPTATTTFVAIIAFIAIDVLTSRLAWSRRTSEAWYRFASWLTGRKRRN